MNLRVSLDVLDIHRSCKTCLSSMKTETPKWTLPSYMVMNHNPNTPYITPVVNAGNSWIGSVPQSF